MAGRCVTTPYQTEREAVCAYFSLGLSHESIIVTFLDQYHGIQMSVRSLRRRLSEWNLRRHNVVNCSEESLVEAVREEVNRSGGELGYRQMWHLLRVGRHIRVSRAKVSRKLNQKSVGAFRRFRLSRPRTSFQRSLWSMVMPIQLGHSNRLLTPRSLLMYKVVYFAGGENTAASGSRRMSKQKTQEIYPPFLSQSWAKPLVALRWLR